MVVAHRGGTGDFPENTVLAITKAVQAGVDGMWLTVQASNDAVPVLYRPADLATLTDGSGPVNSKSAQQLQQLNAGWNFTDPGAGGYPYRDQPTQVPTLKQAIAATPPNMPLFLDLKQTPAEPLVSAVAQVLQETGAAGRSVLYSTDGEITSAATQKGLQVAESRDSTRSRLLNMAVNGHCDPAPDPGKWAGFEMHRDMTVTEELTLGVGISRVSADLWDPPSVECFTGSGMKVIGFAVNTLDDYQLAGKVGLDAVLVDSPLAAQRWRAH
jgi:glycerophosphoryl diester phosphodiesterase